MPQFTDTALEAVSAIQSGENVWCHSMAATPTVLLEALAVHARSLSNVTMMQLHLEHAEAIADPELEGRLRNRCFFAGKTTRQLINEGRADYVPMFLSEIPKEFRRGHQRVDTALVQVSTPDQHGNCSLGISVEATAAACDVAGRIIAHMNPNMPRTHGDSFINLRDIAFAYVEETPLITLEHGEISDVEQRIGEIVSSRVRDGDCLQMGIGAIPDAALSFLHDRRDLGVHTEMFSDGVLDLIEAGVITNDNKKIARGRTVTGFVMGSERLYRFVDDNPEVTFLDIEFVNNPVVIAKNPQVTSINSAIQIDLTGQVCADSMGHKIYSGVGGQVDFVLGATFSDHGKSIIALPSTAKHGALSRLVPALERGAGVVTTRAAVDYVVTEYGIAELRGRSIAERARDLINIAHPDYREILSRAARDDLGLAI
ncbi:acetyl-CoA hydrolase/transferase family protein [Pseudohalioglobus lutimaris]|uniref:4-hydroxybutyrate CoA-transferase n=1 Tax=Pseudohalioglobus lutimaris TaxID=1737061 RepID=A0A2N5X5A0_9GAMM|nr:acetyl-CoA hydrolase/transferase C-terminal domain-containing protein [Pseudohalioglobus lutimaris]PLW69658.1 4-hydroxybutyrate CoA-transferase [Pseudohalioglobus lutimaris]